ncbi:MAG TPA: pentapeptide repeat-containing protein, partial [Beijerinckiaceae bacterium]|nr:pentapeptide repeat-containing protein [Beijerinckiaceae bacterium]
KLFGRVVKDLLFKYDNNTTVQGSNNFLQSQLSTGPVTVTGNTNIALSTVTTVSSLVGLVPGMTVTSTYGGNPVFAPNTYISSIGPGPGFSFVVTTNPIQTVAPATINAALIPPGVQNINVARIYAFSFEGSIYTLPRPSMFLVHGPGTVIDITGTNPNVPTAGRSTLEASGVFAREWEFSSPINASAAPPNLDLRYWEYEKGDFSIRLDSEAGPLEQILLAAALRGADMADRSGANLGIRSGANLSGANVSGANVSGANVSGANLSGANLRNR